MAKSPQALINPDLLVWARESAHVPVREVARRLKLAEERILAWEAGKERPSVAQLRKLAEICRRPVALFFLPEPPRNFGALRDFRRLSGEEPVLVSEELEAEIHRTQELREAAMSLLEESTVRRPFPLSASLQEDPERVGETIRRALAITDANQLNWRGPYEALREWRLAVEYLGVLVANMSGIDVKDARGFSIAHFPLPLIALNTKDTPNGRLFTLMHELVHLALHEGGICEWSHERRLAAPNRRVETFCNQVAAAVLLPVTLVSQVVEEAGLPPADNWPDDLLRRYARALSVSEEALLRRLVTMSLATPDFYAAKRVEYLQKYAEAAKKTSKPVVSYEKRVVGALGTAYLDLAFGAYYARRLTLSELSSYTGVRVTNLAKVEMEAFGITRVPGAKQ